MKCAGSVPAGGLPECRALGVDPILVGCSFEVDCAFTLVVRDARPAWVTQSAIAMDSCRSSMIVPQKSAQPIATSHRLVAAGFRNLAEKQHVVLTLVISLSMIVRQIAVHRPPQGSFAKRNSLRQTLG